LLMAVRVADSNTYQLVSFLLLSPSRSPLF
jgi:hypothetical protein